MGMTLAQFRASGRDVADLGEEITGMDLEGVPGRIYAHHGGPYIERHGGGWLLTLANDQWDDPLESLEALLYEWSVAEGVV
jgi:hypothetical protein